DILKEVLKEFDVDYQIQGNLLPRDYCVQYRESDFNFACRLMEEEGIYYFFTHTENKHKMVLADTPQSHPDVSPANLIFEEMTGGHRREDRVRGWEKVQELQSGKVTLWDYCFQLPDKHLEVTKIIQDSVRSGSVSHKIKLNND